MQNIIVNFFAKMHFYLTKVVKSLGIVCIIHQPQASKVQSSMWLIIIIDEFCKISNWRAPKFLVRPKKGPTVLKSGSSWNLVPLPASSTKGGGEKGVLKTPGLD
jgi:hypothetical protein